MYHRRSFCLSAAAFVAARPALAGSAAFLTQDGYALAGFDPVTYFTNGRATVGDDRYRLIWHNAMWRFSSARNLAAFERDPYRFAPQFGGYCAFSMAEGRVSETSPDAWAIHDGRLYLTHSLPTRDAWVARAAEFTQRAQAHWPAALCP